MSYLNRYRQLCSADYPNATVRSNTINSHIVEALQNGDVPMANVVFSEILESHEAGLPYFTYEPLIKILLKYRPDLGIAAMLEVVG